MTICGEELDSWSNGQSTDENNRRSKKTSKLRVTGLCEGNSPMTDESPQKMVSYAENVSIWWRHDVESSDQLIGLDNGFSSIWRLVVAWTNVD